MTSADLALVSCSDTLAGSLARRQLTQRRKRYAVCLAPPGAIPVPERMTAMPRASRPSGIDERVVQLLLNVVRELLRKLRSALGELEGARHFGRYRGSMRTADGRDYVAGEKLDDAVALLIQHRLHARWFLDRLSCAVRLTPQLSCGRSTQYAAHPLKRTSISPGAQPNDSTS